MLYRNFFKITVKSAIQTNDGDKVHADLTAPGLPNGLEMFFAATTTTTKYSNGMKGTDDYFGLVFWCNINSRPKMIFNTLL